MSEMPDTAFPNANNIDFSTVDFSNLPTTASGGIDWGNLNTSFLTPPSGGFNLNFPTSTTPTDFWGALSNIANNVTSVIRGQQQTKVATAIASHPTATPVATSPLLLFGGLGIAALLLMGGGKSGKK